MKPADKNIKVAEIVIVSVVALICLNSAYSLFFERITAPSPVALKSLDLDQAQGRSPASFAVPTKRPGFETIHINCLFSDESKVQTAGHRLRITGKICDGKQHDLAVENTKTKYKAEVFYSDDSKTAVSTDFIPLDVGMNLINITVIQGDKKVQKTLEITRTE